MLGADVIHDNLTFCLILYVPTMYIHIWLSQLFNLLKKVKAKVILSESGSVKVKVIELK